MAKTELEVPGAASKGDSKLCCEEVSMLVAAVEVTLPGVHTPAKVRGTVDRTMGIEEERWWLPVRPADLWQQGGVEPRHDEREKARDGGLAAAELVSKVHNRGVLARPVEGNQKLGLLVEVALDLAATMIVRRAQSLLNDAVDV